MANPLEVKESYIKVPQVTTIERNALTAANGMVVYDTTANAFYKYENGAWSTFAGGGASWGSISGTLSSQTDLQNALNAKQDSLGFTAENVSNKTDAMSGNTTSFTKYLSAKGVYDWVISLGYQVALTAANFGSFINGLTGKTTPVDADTLTISDSEDSNNAKKLTWANIKAAIKAYFDTLYRKISGKMYLTGGDQTTTSNVAANITGLSVAVEANKRYYVDGIIRIGCNNTGGVNLGATFPAGASSDITLFGYTTTSTAFRYLRILVSGTLYGQLVTLNASGGFAYVKGELSVGSTAGTLQFIFASGTNTQTSTVQQLGTLLTIEEI